MALMCDLSLRGAAGAVLESSGPAAFVDLLAHMLVLLVA